LYQESIFHRETIEQRDQLIAQLTKQTQKQMEEEERMHQCTELEYQLAEYIKQRNILTTEFRHWKIRAATKSLSISDSESTRYKQALPDALQEIEQKIQATKDAIDSLHENTQYACDWFHHHHGGSMMRSGIGYAEGEENGITYCTPILNGINTTASQRSHGLSRMSSKEGYQSTVPPSIHRSQSMSSSSAHYPTTPGKHSPPTTVTSITPLNTSSSNPSSSASHIEKIRGKLGFLQRSSSTAIVVNNAIDNSTTVN
jgi:hypothetical protein